MRIFSKNAAFTLIELITVISIITILAGLTLGAVRYVNLTSKANRTKVEIAALESAISDYTLDYGEPPQGDDDINAPPSGTSSRRLYQALIEGSKVYIQLKENQMGGEQGNRFIQDPYGNPYGYNSSKEPTLNPNAPEVSLWSSAGNSGKINKWIKNW